MGNQKMNTEKLFEMPDSPAPMLETARRILERCNEELNAATVLMDEQGNEAEPAYDAAYYAQRRAARVVANLEALEMLKHL
jgi:hypothetical protein